MRVSSLTLLLLTGLFTLSAQTAFVTGSGYTTPPAITVAPGQVATFYVGGLSQSAPGLQQVSAVLAVAGTQQSIPVVSAKPMDQLTVAVTVLIPFTVVPGATSSSGALLPVTIQFGESDGTADICAGNACTPPVSLNVAPSLPHIITTCDTLYGTPSNPCQLAITHQDGTLVTNSAPAKGGEILSAWAVGLGVPVSGVPAAGSGPIAMNDIDFNTGFVVGDGATFTINSSTPYLFAGLASPTEGLYQINFIVPQPPSDLQSCTQTSEWFYISGNMNVSVFRNLPNITTGSTASFTLGYSVTESVGAGSVSAICVTL